MFWQLPAPHAEPPQVFLTFDDGPFPQVTDYVLDTLAAYQAKGSFFCVGKQAQAQPQLIQKIQAAGHCVGNHSFSHLHGWHSNTAVFMDDVAKAAEILPATTWFRPPYGKLDYGKYKAVRRAGYRIAMWDILTYDFDKQLSAEAILRKTLPLIANGSIIVLHDQPTCFDKMQILLPAYLDFAQQQGFRCAALPF